ncbi:hypothetical protein ACSQ67_021855 [Phaseolus vulgaris]|uniref:YGGT family protein n=1 Tax=Phaseolus vulgaris TaxID=3885 RepID=V5N873_PHAVU|nr:YGGT family protein [Phaseolus vulgaris]
MAMASSVAVPSHALRFHTFFSRTAPSSSSFNLRSQPQPLCVKCHCNGPPPPVIASGETLTDLLRGSTRTLTTLMGLAVLVAKSVPVGNWSGMSGSTVSTIGPLFFAAVRARPSGALNTPLTVVAAGLGKWLDIYSGVLMVRVLLSWFPNIPWERQPLSAIRDLCDPYLNLFRNIIPPVFDTLDVSPLLAFAVLGTLGSILQTAI